MTLKPNYEIHISTSVKQIIEIVDFSLENCQGIFYKNGKEIESGGWQLIKDHWINRLYLDIGIKISLGFSDEADYFLVYLRFKGVSFE